MTSTNRNKVDHETINKINDNIDKDLNSFENVYLDRSEKIKELTNNGIRYNQELIGKYNKQ